MRRGPTGFHLPASTGLSKKKKSLYFKLGRHKPRNIPSVEDEFQSFGGSLALMEYMEDMAFRRGLPFFQPQLAVAYVKEIRDKSRSLRRALERLRLDCLDAHAHKLLGIKRMAGNRPSDSWQQELKPYQHVVEIYSHLDHFEELMKTWPRTLTGPGRRGEIQLYFWLGFLVPYTYFLTDEPKWAWIKRWAREKIEWASNNKPRDWWRDANMAASVNNKKRASLLAPSQCFLVWLGLLNQVENDPDTTEAIGLQYLGCLYEVSRRSVPLSTFSRFVDFWKEIIQASKMPPYKMINSGILSSILSHWSSQVTNVTLDRSTD